MLSSVILLCRSSEIFIFCYFNMLICYPSILWSWFYDSSVILVFLLSWYSAIVYLKKNTFGQQMIQNNKYSAIQVFCDCAIGCVEVVGLIIVGLASWYSDCRITRVPREIWPPIWRAAAQKPPFPERISCFFLARRHRKFLAISAVVSNKLYSIQ